MLELKNVWIIRSTDTDISFTALLNNEKLDSARKDIYIHYNKLGEATKYCHINDLVKLIAEDPAFSLLRTRDIPIPTFVGLLHFVSGCDDLSFLRGITKNFCFKAFLRYNELICPESDESVSKILDGDHAEVFQLMVRFLSCVYCHKFASSFQVNEVASLLSDLSVEQLLEDIRKRTWHMTIASNNTMPSLSAIQLHSKRLCYVLNSFAKATEAFHSPMAPALSGWKIVVTKEHQQLLPDWDSEESIAEINVVRKAVFKNCKCKKTSCKDNHCGCRRDGFLCTKMCSCLACKNLEFSIKNKDEDTGDSDNSDDDQSADNHDSGGNDSSDDLDSDFQKFKMDMEAMASRGYLLSSDDESDKETIAYDDDHCSNDEEQNYESD